MKSNKILLGFFCILAIFIQISFFSNYGCHFQNGFLIGLVDTERGSHVSIVLMYLLIPVLFILFFNSNALHNLINGYGKLLIIRNYSKTRLFLKNYIKIIALTVGAVVAQLTFYYFFNDRFSPVETNLLKSIIMYFVVLNLILSVQYVLELFIAPHIANVALFIYLFVSYYIVQITVESSVIMKILLFPSLLFGMQNGAVNGDSVYNLYLMIMILFNIITVTIGILKFKKTDIFWGD